MFDTYRHYYIGYLCGSGAGGWGGGGGGGCRGDGKVSSISSSLVLTVSSTGSSLSAKLFVARVFVVVLSRSLKLLRVTVFVCQLIRTPSAIIALLFESATRLTNATRHVYDKIRLKTFIISELELWYITTLTDWG